VELSLKGKVSLVTGGARGIGKAIADTLVAAGSDIVLIDVLEADLKTAEADLAAKGVKALGLKADVTSFESIEKATDEIIEKFGKIDVMVNNAGITRDNLLIGMSDEEWDKVIAVNLKGTFNMIRVVGRQMLRKRSGSIINIASISGHIGTPGQANYAASKAGVMALTKTSAREFAKRGIRVNAVAPGFIETAMTAVLPEEVKAKYRDQTPLNRNGLPADVAGAVLFFACDISSFVTGQTLNVDGGMVMM
jgi:3-oxoacyl-[acyl-carrier protein] reductase